MKLSLVIVSWNVRDLLGQAIASVLQNPPQAEYEIIVVDNASGDGSADMVAEKFPQVKLIRSPQNVGFAAGNNLGFAAAAGEYLLCLNPDTEMPGGTLDFIIAAFDRDARLGALGVRLLNSDGTLQLSCKSFPAADTILYNAWGLDVLFPRSRIFGKYNMTWFKHDREIEVDQPMGAALGLRRSALEQTGVYDERFFMYFDEVDLCYRLKQAGWRIKFFPQVWVTHHWAQSTRQALWKMNKQWYISFKKYLQKNKHYPGWLAGLLLSSMLWLKPLLIVLLMGGLIFLVKRSGF
ncbi:glycosyl transferase group 2 [Candidatus Termititenax persephonae]|uniref:Glycosyl transferase group 2 n=1 Tax=Candidatus Termititenax persephonae TaxID=2218525 RepID=A0A388TGU6_9BACT|nr:glycosyl transferase group 2 [Candidatus Termititenax persephonae]